MAAMAAGMAFERLCRCGDEEEEELGECLEVLLSCLRAAVVVAL